MRRSGTLYQQTRTGGSQCGPAARQGGQSASQVKVEAAERQPPAQKQPHGGGTVEPIAAAGGAAAAATAVAPLPTYLPACLLSLSLSRAAATAAHNQTSNESIVSREKSASQFYLLIRTIKTTRSVTRARSQVSFNIQLVELIACIRRRCQSVRVHRQREEEKPKGSTRNGANRSVSDSVPNERVRRLSPHS